MSQFNNVTVSIAANVYFDGGVISRSIYLADGSHKTLGVALPGQYQFTTQVEELMEFYSGEVEVLFPEETIWQTITAGMSFVVPAKATFHLRALLDLRPLLLSWHFLWAVGLRRRRSRRILPPWRDPVLRVELLAHRQKELRLRQREKVQRRAAALVSFDHVPLHHDPDMTLPIVDAPLAPAGLELHTLFFDLVPILLRPLFCRAHRDVVDETRR